jgi:hypothetical protein
MTFLRVMTITAEPTAPMAKRKKKKYIELSPTRGLIFSPSPPSWRAAAAVARAKVRGEIRPLTPTLSQREGAPLNWRPSADAVAGRGSQAQPEGRKAKTEQP